MAARAKKDAALRAWKWKIQQGTSIIAALFIIVILAFMGLMFVTLMGTGGLSAVDDLQAAQALYVAEGGIQYALENGVYCTYNYGPTNIDPSAPGSGSFTVITTSASPCIIESTGTVGSASRTVRVEVSGGTLLNELFPAGSIPSDAVPGNDCDVNPALPWCFDYQFSEGSSRYHTDTATPDGTGSLLAQTTVGRRDRLRGYRQWTFATPVTAGTTIALQMQYKKFYRAAIPRSQAFQIQLVYSTGTTVTPGGWGDATRSNANTWTLLAPPAFTVPVGSTVTAVRIYFDLRNRNDRAAQTQIWFDEVRLTRPGGATILGWQEVVQ